MAIANQSADNQVQSDKMIHRGRTSRWIVLILSVLLIPAMIFFLAIGLGKLLKFYPFIGVMLGTGLGFATALWLISRSTINNGAYVAFVTVNPLISLMNLGSPYVGYGPGFHVCYWWEQRSSESVVNLTEVAESIAVDVQGKGGSFKINGSVRLRPDISKLFTYLERAGAVVGDVTDIIVTRIAQQLQDKDVIEGIALLHSLNEELLRDFKHGQTQAQDVTEFEERFGVTIGDVTIATIKPSQEVQKALDGAAEMRALGGAVALSLGYSDMTAVNKAVEDKVIKSEAVQNALKLAMAMTDNLHGMKLTDQNFNLKITGDEELAKALGAIAPAAAAYLANHKSN